MDKSIEQLKVDIERHENALNRLKMALDMLTGSRVAMESENCYLRQFCENDEVHRELVERLKKHDAYDLYIKEHKKQRKDKCFGKFGKMIEVCGEKTRSGLTWSETSQGYHFWRKILVDFSH